MVRVRGLLAAALLTALSRGAFAFGDRSPQQYADDCHKRGGDDACNTIGYMYQHGIDVPLDYARAGEFFKTACRRGSARGCYNLGTLYADGQGVTRDEAAAMGFFDKACRGGEISGCANLANGFLDGRGVPRAPSKAADLFSRVCAADPGKERGPRAWRAIVVAGCCNSLANLYERGEGIAQDVNRAASLYGKSCDLGDAMGCGNLRHLQAYGPSRTPPNGHKQEYEGNGPTR